MKESETLGLDKETRKNLWNKIFEAMEEYNQGVKEKKIAPRLDPDSMHALLQKIDFSEPISPFEAADFVLNGLRENQVHVSHPGYFGLFNPRPAAMGIAADAITAAFNPQLATWSHSPFAVSLEQHLIKTFGGRFGYDEKTIDGVFTTGGGEANHMAILTALRHKFPEFVKVGLRGIGKQPLIYVSSESHHSLARNAMACGLGFEAVRRVPTDSGLRMDTDSLERQIIEDRKKGFEPFLIVGTVGTTGSGIVDPINEIAHVAERQEVWFHVDAAWGGAVVFLPELKYMLSGTEISDSITFDAHKWLSCPMGAGMFITSHERILYDTFGIATGYIPKDSSRFAIVDPYLRSLQWSRRFMGLKLFLALSVAGWEGYAHVIRRMIEMGNMLRRELRFRDWETLNRTELPLVNFVDGKREEGKSLHALESMANEVVSSGKAWISVVHIGENVPALRACITNYATGEEDVSALAESLDRARDMVYGQS